MTFSLLGGAYIHGNGQSLLDNGDRAREIWHMGARVGWAFCPFGEIEGSFGFTPTKTASARQNVYTYLVNLIGQLPIHDQIVPYVTFGAGGITFDEKNTTPDSDFALNYGAGIKFFLFKNLAIRPEFSALTSFENTHTAILGTLNLMYYMTWGDPEPEVVATPVPEPTPEPTPEPIQEVEVVPTPTPIPDRDGDGIPDAEDQCPDKPETKNDYKDEDGCPDNEIEQLSGLIKGIHFSTGSAQLREDSYPVLNRAAELLKKYGKARIEIQGHTDSTGSLALNERLSGDRAESVRQYLIQKGIDGARLEAKGYGPSIPRATNNTAEGRALNRRIEFRVLNPSELK